MTDSHNHLDKYFCRPKVETPPPDDWNGVWIMEDK